MVRRVELSIFQAKLNRAMTINRPLQLIVPFEINEPEDDIRVTRSRRNAAVNAEANIKVISEWQVAVTRSVTGGVLNNVTHN